MWFSSSCFWAPLRWVCSYPGLSCGSSWESAEKSEKSPQESVRRSRPLKNAPWNKRGPCDQHAFWFVVDHQVGKKRLLQLSIYVALAKIKNREQISIFSANPALLNTQQCDYHRGVLYHHHFTKSSKSKMWIILRDCFIVRLPCVSCRISTSRG